MMPPTPSFEDTIREHQLLAETGAAIGSIHAFIGQWLLHYGLGHLTPTGKRLLESLYGEEMQHLAELKTERRALLDAIEARQT